MRAVTLVLAGLLALASASSDKKVVCYFGSWAVYRPGNGKFAIDYIDPSLCTHLIYTFVGITESGDVRVLDGWQDLPDNWGKDGFGRFNKLSEISPETKTMIAIGGWNEGSAKYSHVVANPQIRRKFVQNVVAFVKKHGFDGFDLDWEYPNQRGGVRADIANYVALLKEMREEFDKDGLILSAAVGAAEKSASLSYDIPNVSKYLHFINLMAYDLHGVWDKKTGINAPLYAGSWETTDAERGLNVDASIQYWLKSGAPAEKLILGVPLYGRGFTLSNPKENGIGAPATQPATAGPYTREPGMLGYNEICESFLKGGWEVHYEEEQRVPYAVKGNQWIGYDDQKSLTEKAEYAKKLGLGGMMVWSVETDDFAGICGEKYPLLKTINHVLRDGAPPLPTRPVPTTTPGSNSGSGGNNNPTQPQQPTQTEAPPAPKGVCKKEGYVRDPKKCNTYYYCQAYNGEFIISTFNCPDPLVFDANTTGCNYKTEVQC